MRHERGVLLILLAGLAAGCGGGGGGGGGPPAAGGGGAPTRQSADLKGTNASLFAEALRDLVGNEIASLDETVLGIGGDVPSLPAGSHQETSPCGVSGNVSISVNISGSSIDVTLDHQACVESGVTLAGKVALSFTNINAAARRYDYRVTYTRFTVTAGSVSRIWDGTATIHTDVLGAGTHAHEVVLNLTIDDTRAAITYTADNLGVTARHSVGNYDAWDVTAARGAIGVSGRGFADVSYLNGEIHFSGAGGSETSVTLNGVVYAMRYKDTQGQDREVSIPASSASLLSVLDGRNSPPDIGFLPNVTLNAGTVQQFDLRDKVIDPDFEPVDITLAVASGPAGQTLPITRIAAGRYEVAAGNSGVFTVRVTATDLAGARAERDFVVTVNGDSDRDGLLDSYDPDDDNDGVGDAADAFPFDPTESRDADRDGIGDNADSDDDNDGVDDAHDAFPLDPACSSASDGNGQQCFLSAIRRFDSLIVVDGVLHFVDFENKAVYRWDASTSSFGATWQLGTAVPSSSRMTSAAYVPAHDRFYFGYDSGAITVASAQSGIEQAFATVPEAAQSVAAAGNFLLVQDPSGAWVTHYTFAADGSLRWSAEWNYYSRAYAFNPAENRIYFFRDDTSPNDLHYEEIDQTTGVRLSAGETPYHGAYGILPPIVFSPSGNLILIGSGNLFNAGSLTWAGAIPRGLSAAHWDAADGLILLREVGGSTVLERRDAALAIVEQRTFEGAPRAIERVLQGYIVVTESPERLILHPYAASNDSDADGVANTVDRFPLDVAASIDTDGDGYPDSWNGGKTQADSTTGLVLDAYPTESACYLPEHGDGTTCNIASTIPSYLPDAVVGDVDGTAYLLSTENNRIYRYSGPGASHLSPIVVGSDTMLNTIAPTLMEYSPQHDRLYLGYPSGAITYVDLSDAQLREQPFANLADAVTGLGAAGEYLAAHDHSGAWGTHYYFDEAGVLRDSADWNYYSRDYEWNAALRRLFFFRHDQSPTDLHFEQIGVDGTILSKGETPYHGDYPFSEPIVMSPDDQYVLIGGGEIFRASDLTWYRSLANDLVAAIWDANGRITALEAVGGGTRIHRYDANQVWQNEENRGGEPLALLEYPAGYLLVTHDGTRPVFSQISR